MQLTQPEPPQTRSYGPWLVALGAALWGTESAWRIPLNKIFDAEVIVFYEHVLTVLLFAPVIIAQRKYLRNIPKSAYGYLFFSGVAGSAVGTIFFTLALRHGNASVVNVLLNIQPVFSTTVACLLFKDRLSKGFYLWAPLAIVAGMVLSTEKPGELWVSFQAAGVSLGTGFALLCAFFWGLSTVAGRGAMIHMPAPLAAGLRCVVGLWSMALILLIRGKFYGIFLSPPALEGHFTQTMILFMLLATISGGFPTYIYFLGLKYTRASTAGYFEMMQTIAALLVTWVIPALVPNSLLPPSPLSIHQIVAGACLVVFVFLVQQSQHSLEKEPPAPRVH